MNRENRQTVELLVGNPRLRSYPAVGGGEFQDIQPVRVALHQCRPVIAKSLFFAFCCVLIAENAPTAERLLNTMKAELISGF
jgi:hypothetical protein